MHEYRSEVYAMDKIIKMGLPTARIYAKGEIRDKYLFRYIIMEYIKGRTLGDVKAMLSTEQKKDIATKIRTFTTKWSTECEPFNDIDVLNRTINSKRWQGASVEIRNAQQDVINELRQNPYVFVHGDLTEDNIILDYDDQIFIIDFADAVLAPATYEDMPLIYDAFKFDNDFLGAYYEEIGIDRLIDKSIRAVLCHEYGYHTITNMFGPIRTLKELRDKIRMNLLKVPST